MTMMACASAPRTLAKRYRFGPTVSTVGVLGGGSGKVGAAHAARLTAKASTARRGIGEARTLVV